MSTPEYQTLIRDAVARLKEEAPYIALRMAQTGLTLLKERSIRDGISVDGSYAEYSSEEVYTSSFKKKTLNAGGSAYIRGNKKGTWKGLREAQGRSSSKVNLFYSGRLWTSIRMLEATQEGYRYSVLIGPEGDEETLILLGNLKRYGNFMKLNADEIALLLEDAGEEIKDVIGPLL